MRKTIICFNLGWHDTIRKVKQTCQPDLEIVGDKNKMRRKMILRATFALLVSAAVLTVCSKNSFLYPLNDWVDVNCFFTVGRGIIHGLVPYRDLYDQKGPLLYEIYALASLISENSFLGVFLIEVLLFSVFLFFSGRIAETLSEKPVAFWLTALGIGIGVPLSPAFSHGGSAEEFFLPVFAASLFIVLKAMHSRRELSRWDGILLGAFTSAALWTKYTFCGLYAGMGAAILVWYLADHRGKKLPRLILHALAGALAVSAAVLFRYLIHGALPSLWNAYFVDNLTRYSRNIRSGNYPDPLPNLLNNLSWSIPIMIGLTGFLLFIRKSWRELVLMLLSGIGLFIFTYASGRKYPYYAMVMACFASAGYGMLFRIIPTRLAQKKGFQTAAVILPCLLAILSPQAAYHWSSNTYLINIPREETPQYRFTQIIRQSEDRSLLNYGFLDGGYYLAAESLPVTRFFCTLNNDLPEMKEELQSSIQEGKTAYIVTRGQRLKSRNYRLADQCSMLFEGRNWTYYLYERISSSSGH